ALFPHLTAAANVGFGLPRGERSQVAPLLELIGLGALGERYPHQLSGGQQQRVALARALAIEPRVVLLDEPFSSLDASLRTELRLDVARILRETATTTVLVTHDQDEALALADKVAVLGEGRVLACAEPRTLYHDPADAIAASSVGAANLIPAHVHGGRASCALGSVPLVGAAPEGAAQLLLRPEQLALAREPDGGAVAAEVVELDYHGHEALVRVRVAEQVLLARVSGELALVAQERVWVRAVGAGRAWPAPSM
ncbi:MAG TPA: ABC transporter ATP-binding protein, partial [Solirubrobacteraceae bacterium]|nr:ABC transporter ATP-binding protein [Solirubrobacteraceae bacterium]